MILHVKILAFFIIFATTLSADVKKVDELVEKVDQSKSQEEKKVLIEQIKKELTDINKKARDEADALIKAKSKTPMKPYKQVE